MKKVILRTRTNKGDKCKVYTMELLDVLIFHKYTLYIGGLPTKIPGAEVEVKRGIIGGKEYILAFHWWSIKKETLEILMKGLDIIEKGEVVKIINKN